MSTQSHPLTPIGATFLGRGELTKGRGYLEWMDTKTGSNFTVPEAQATAEVVERTHREHRARSLSAGQSFAPIP